MKDKKISNLDLFITFFQIGIVTFGGGYAMISLVEKQISDVKNWIDKEEILDIIATAQILPGAIAANMACIIGYKLNKKIGSLAALLGVVMPSFLIILIIASLFTSLEINETVNKIMRGIMIAIVFMISKAGYNMARRNINDYFQTILFAITVTLVIFFGINAIILIFIGGVLGVIYTLWIKKELDEGREEDA